MKSTNTPWLAITQRVDVDGKTGERRNALDQRWGDFVLAAGFLPLILPNSRATAQALLAACRIQGILLTGGNSLMSCGGDAPERDEFEFWLLEQAQLHRWPVLGVCRGMQLIQSHQGSKLTPVSNHIAAEQEIQIEGTIHKVNSYHTWGCCEENPELSVWAVASDGVQKAVKHKQFPWWGIMWHPERISPFRNEDFELFHTIFSK